ncbi:hypothetical protein PCASD_06895 [Puccinia coronata f. sp. avenae]|uniref:Uncharacterized protein n=1 Tax=Puccinia coronata f. sp. avenae TaxID=200324 RepID=A0A2N5UYN8_9BASI|nr:hypothetical protein PCASD_06895 [Puccinia coronata f. sp. avenae]
MSEQYSSSSKKQAALIGGLLALFLLTAVPHILIGNALFFIQLKPDWLTGCYNMINLSNTSVNIQEIQQHSLTLTLSTRIDLHKLVNLPLITHITLNSQQPIRVLQLTHHLAEIQLTQPLILPLTPTKTYTHIHLRISFPEPDLLPHIITSQESLNLTLNLQQLVLRPSAGWLNHNILRRLTTVSVSELNLQFPLTIPDIPPEWRDPGKLITLDSYDFYTTSGDTSTDSDTGQDTVGLRATISVPNPIQELKRFIHDVRFEMATVPWRFPLAILLAGQDGEGDRDDDRHGLNATPLASALTLPLLLNSSSPTLSIQIEGRLLSSLQTSLQPDVPSPDPRDGPLAAFLDRFLKGHSNHLVVRYGDAPKPSDEAHPFLIQSSSPIQEHNAQLTLGPHGAAGDDGLPEYLTAFLEHMDIRMAFPGRQPGELVESIRVEDMSISMGHVFPPSVGMTCSGRLEAVVVLPGELAGLTGSLTIEQVLPDVILLDGGLPNGTVGASSGAVPAANAFARLAPAGYLPATLAPLPGGPDDSHLGKLLLQATLVDVPLHVLDGRQSVFRAYAAKYLLRHRHHPSDNTGHDGVPIDQGLLTSIMGSFDAHALLVNTFRLPLHHIHIQGSFFV